MIVDLQVFDVPSLRVDWRPHATDLGLLNIPICGLVVEEHLLIVADLLLAHVSPYFLPASGPLTLVEGSIHLLLQTVGLTVRVSGWCRDHHFGRVRGEGARLVIRSEYLTRIGCFARIILIESSHQILFLHPLVISLSLDVCLNFLNLVQSFILV